MASLIIQQPWLNPYLNPQPATKRGRGEMREELPTDNTLFLPWQTEVDLSSVSPATTTNLYHSQSASQQVDTNEQNRLGDARIPPGTKMEPPEQQSLYAIPQYYEPIPGPHNLSQSVFQGGQQPPQKMSRNAFAASAEGLEQPSQQKPKKTRYRKRERRAAEKLELEHLRALVYGPSKPEANAATTNPQLHTAQIASKTDTKRLKRQKAKARKRARLATESLARSRGSTGSATMPATGANTTDLVGNRVSRRLASVPETEHLDYGGREENDRAKITLIKMEHYSPKGRHGCSEEAIHSASDYNQAKLPYNNGAQMFSGQGVEQIGAEAFVPRALPGQSEPPIYSTSDQTLLGEPAERHPYDIWAEKMDQGIMAEKNRFAQDTTHINQTIGLGVIKHHFFPGLGEDPPTTVHRDVVGSAHYGLPRASKASPCPEKPLDDSRMILRVLSPNTVHHPCNTVNRSPFAPSEQETLRKAACHGGIPVSSYGPKPTPHAEGGWEGDYRQQIGYPTRGPLTQQYPYRIAESKSGSHSHPTFENTLA